MLGGVVVPCSQTSGRVFGPAEAQAVAPTFQVETMAELDDEILKDALSFGAGDDAGSMNAAGRVLPATVQLKVQGDSHLAAFGSLLC